MPKLIMLTDFDMSGLDYDSARDATPRLYGVSSGDGNNGVSHMFADYYVRTNDPWRLARLAMVTSFKPEWQAKAIEECDVDGEADYTIYAVIYEPLDDHGSWCNEYECHNACAQAPWTVEDASSDDATAECPTCDAGCQPVASDYNSYSEANGAWSIVEVFPEDEPREGTMRYDSLADAFSEADLALIVD